MRVEQTSTPRVMRVFLSSTFRDMQAEREELVKRALPRLRHLCEKRGVVWSEVDLRWGVTDEQKAEGKVLPICLAEIHRCRPYFIGLLGECYGWVADELSPALLEREPWLAGHQGRSVTELEILHGVLNNPEMAEHAFFYFRDPAYLDHLPPEQRDRFRGAPSAEEIRQFGPEEAARRAEEGRLKLARLKQRLRESGFPVVEDYPDPKALGELVVRDLTAVLDRLYPEGSEPDPLDAEAAEHEAFGAARARVYIHREQYYAALNAHAAGRGPPLVVLGESGSGKSALLANWARRYRDAHPETVTLVHYLGASPSSADWVALLRRLLGELGRRCGIDQPVPKERPDLREAFVNGLHQAAAGGRVVLILDGLDQLEDREAADLVWLPGEIPESLRLIVSTLPGRALDVLAERGWPTLRVQPLGPEERRQLIVEYLAQYAKALPPAQVDRIAAVPQAANPLYLRSLLEELRLWGKHEDLDRRIGSYLEAASVPALYQRILERYEHDYEAERPGLVREAMAFLWASRRGLMESELFDLLGTPNSPLPAAIWSPLALAAEQSLVSHSGLIGFFHDHLRQAVNQRYLVTDERRRQVHLRLAGYFARREIGPRMVEELPWQLSRAGEWPLLATLLADPAFFREAQDRYPYEVAERWAEVEERSDQRMVEAYGPVLESPGRNPEHAWSVGSLLSDCGYPAQAMAIWAGLADHCRETGDLGRLPQCLHGHASILMARGELDEALRLFQEGEAMCRARGNRPMLQRILGSEAILLLMRGARAEAAGLLKEKYELCRALGDREGLQESLETQAAVLREEGKLDQALEVIEESERRYRETGNRRGLQTVLGAKAGILQEQGDLDGAMRLNREKERICRELGNRDGLQTSLANQATICHARGELEEAARLLEDSERIARELGNRDMLPGLLGMRAVILQEQGDLDAAMQLLAEQERLCQEMGMRQGVAISLGSQAEVRVSRGEFGEALRLLREIERIADELGDRAMLEQSRRNQRLVVQLRGAAEPDRPETGGYPMATDRFDTDYEFLAPGPRDALRRAIQAGNDSPIDGSGLSAQQIDFLKKIAARHRKGIKTTPKDLFG